MYRQTAKHNCDYNTSCLPFIFSCLVTAVLKNNYSFLKIWFSYHYSSLFGPHESLGNSLPFRTWPYCCPRCRRPSQLPTGVQSYWALCHRCPSWLCWVSCGCTWRWFSNSAFQPEWLRLGMYVCMCVCVGVMGWRVLLLLCLGGHTSRVMQLSTLNNKNYCVYCTHTCTHTSIHIYYVFGWIFAVWSVNKFVCTFYIILFRFQLAYF